MVIFNRGRIEQQGNPNEIIKHPRTPFIMKFVGDTNIMPANAQVRVCVRARARVHARVCVCVCDCVLYLMLYTVYM